MFQESIRADAPIWIHEGKTASGIVWRVLAARTRAESLSEDEFDEKSGREGLEDDATKITHFV